MSTRALCISKDAGVRGVVDDALGRAGLTVEHADSLPDPVGEVAVVVVDRAARQTAGDRLRAVATPVVVVGDDLDDDGLITLMLEAPISHVIGDATDPDLGITSKKLVSGDLFGLEKYVGRLATIGERVIADAPAKRLAMIEVCSWAESCGARRPAVHRLANVVDELVMNVLREGVPAVLRWACDGTVLAVSVGDKLGTMRQRDVIDNLRRARSERGRPQDSSPYADGAGLGLYLVLANVASFIVNVEPGRRTEVVCLFDVDRLSHGARSLHVFAAP
jgi:hypothetical protein